MKKLLLAFVCIVALSVGVYAVTINTSCGTSHEVKCDTCSVQALAQMALAIDKADCDK